MDKGKANSSFMDDGKSKSSPMAEEKINPATSHPKEATNSKITLPMVNKEIKLATMEPCGLCRELPGTKVEFSNSFREMSSYECFRCGEMRFLYDEPSDGSSTNSYIGSDEDDNGSDRERW